MLASTGGGERGRGGVMVRSSVDGWRRGGGETPNVPFPSLKVSLYPRTRVIGDVYNTITTK